MIENGISQKERLETLNNTAIREIEILKNDNNIMEIQDADINSKNKLIENKWCKSKY